jgi:hypothetical protein
MCQELNQELQRGKVAAEALVYHLQATGATNLLIPISLGGRDYVVKAFEAERKVSVPQPGNKPTEDGPVGLETETTLEAWSIRMIRELCALIEEMPASEVQTQLSIQAAALSQNIERYQNACKNPTQTPS